jgi:hypothetical protein
MTSIGIAGKTLVLRLHFTHRIHLEPDTSLKPHVPAQNYRCTFLHHVLTWKHLRKISVKICILLLAERPAFDFHYGQGTANLTTTLFLLRR